MAAAPLITQPARVRWGIKSATAVLVTDANVANRVGVLEVAKGTVVMYRCLALLNQDASKTMEYNWQQMGEAATGSGTTFRQGTIPVDMLCNNEVEVRITTVGIQTGDQWSALTILVEEWIEPLT